MRTLEREDKMSSNIKKNSFTNLRDLLMVKKRTAPITFALVVALSLALGACGGMGGEAKADWMALLSQGNEAKAKQDYTAASEHYGKALEAAEKKYGKESGQAATCLGYSAEVYRSLGEWRLAYFAYKRLVPIREKLDPGSRELKDLNKEYAYVKQKIKDYGIKTDDELDKETQKAAVKKPVVEKPKHQKKH
ncbi:MAG: tetratricopeptide repeat protein [Leptolyngbya sp.]|nr:tetratricopeptide repeat protein [Candidatus Melainabacteria bacterium]